MGKPKKAVLAVFGAAAIVVVAIVAGQYAIEAQRLRRLESEDHATWTGAGQLLIDAGSRRAIAPIVAAAMEKDSDFARWHRRLVARFGAPTVYGEAQSLYVAAVRGQNLELCRALLRADRHDEPPCDGLVAMYVAALEGRYQETRWQGALLLGRIGPTARRVVPDLIRETRGACRDVRFCAVEALGRIGQDSDEVVTALRQALADDDDRVAGAAAVALAGLGEAARDAVPEIAALLRRDERRRAAAWALAELGDVAKPATDAIVDALGHSASKASHVWSIGPSRPDDDGSLQLGWEMLPVPSTEELLIECLERWDLCARTFDAGHLSLSRKARAVCLRALARQGPTAAPAIPRLIEVMGRREMGSGCIAFPQSESLTERQLACADVLAAIGAQAVRTLVETLDRPSSPGGTGAAFALGAIGDASPEVLRTLRHAAMIPHGGFDAQEWRRRIDWDGGAVAAGALRMLDPTTDLASMLLERAPWSAFAYSAARWVGPEAVEHVPALLAQLDGEGGPYANVAAAILGRLADFGPFDGEDGTVRALERHVTRQRSFSQYERTASRHAAAEALIRFARRAPRVIRPLVEAATSGDDIERVVSILDGLRRAGAVAGVALPDLLEALGWTGGFKIVANSIDARARDAALLGLLAAIDPHDPRVVSAFCRPFERAQQERPVETYATLSNLLMLPAPPRRVCPTLRGLARDGEQLLRERAVRLLVRVDEVDDSMVEAIAGLLDRRCPPGYRQCHCASEFSTHGADALEAAAELGPRAKSLAPRLRPWLRDRPARAARALWNVAGEAHVDVVVRALQDGASRRRPWAIEGAYRRSPSSCDHPVAPGPASTRYVLELLGDYGPRAACAVPHIRRVRNLCWRDVDLRDLADDTLRRIAGVAGS